MNEPIYALQTCFALFLFWAFWHFGWKSFALEQFRQNLLSIRCDLFDMAANQVHGLEFSSPVYVEVRRALNGRIRFAHRISFAQIVITLILSVLPGINLFGALKSFKARPDILIDLVDNRELQRKLQLIDKRAGIEICKYLALTSPAFIAYSIVVGIGALIRAIFSAEYRRTIRQEIEKELGHSIRTVDSQVESLDSPRGDLTLAPVC
jgi:hypothetical protein